MHRRPPPLEPGSRVALVSPSGPLRSERQLRPALDNVAARGWEPVVLPNAAARLGYLAGSDEQRVADFNAAANDDSIDGIWCVRGGYGATRLLDTIDYDAWRRRPRALMGFSDITALHVAIGARAGLVCYHGPTARSRITPFAAASLVAALAGTESCGTAPGGRPIVGGRARGILVGGNLAVLCAMMGTPYAPSFAGAILVVEDVNESIYRIDRMLTQLRLAGALRQCVGIVFGAFTEVPVEPNDDGRTVDGLLDEFATAAGIPCFANAPVGHIDDQWTVPLGAPATIDADMCSLSLDEP